MSDADPPLPSYDRPPINEVAFAFVFDPLPGWNVSHLGRMYLGMQAEYPHFDSQDAAPVQIESFDEVFPADVQPLLHMMSGTARGLYVSADENRVVQVQHNYFIVNWRKRKPDDVYPRYESELRPFFAREWGRFSEYLAANQLPAPVVRQCEVVYVNDIPRGEGWESMADLGKVIAPLANRPADRFLPAPETLGAAFAYRWPNGDGRLRVNLHHVRRMSDAREVLQLQLIARGRPSGPELSDALECLDTGRRWIVLGFSDLTARDVQENIWGRRP